MQIDFSNSSVMDALSAQKIVQWTYPPPYDIYTIKDECLQAVKSMVEPQNHYYVVSSDDGEPVGFYCFGTEAQVAGGNYQQVAIDIGGGLKPELTGLAYGKSFLEEGVRLGRKLFGATRFRVTVLAKNERSLKVCRAVGFLPSETFVRVADQATFVIMEMPQVPFP